MRDACLKFGTPVSGGNVSFYNESPKGAVDPTPTIGMVGLIEGRDPITSFFKDEGDVVLLLGTSREELGGSEYLKTIFNVKSGLPPRLDLDEAKTLLDLLAALAKEKLLKSAHDCSEGGLAVALAESCILNEGHEIGAVIHAEAAGISKEAFLFGESQSRVVISINPSNIKRVEEMINSYKFPCRVIGKVGGKALKINDKVSVPVSILVGTWRGAVKRRLED
jgi:phosphoribosylformylglycinamidine synthase